MSVTEPVLATRKERRYLDFKDPTHELYLGVKLITLVVQRPISAGYSNVHCAHFEGNPEDKVAVKCPLYSSDEEQNKLMDQALEKEITILKRVQHPSILPFIGLVRYGQWNDSCIVTPWMKNGSLRQYLKIQPDADRLEILIDVAIAVGYLHSGAGLPHTSCIIHGDIHAGNVLISDEGKALLADFGLSKRVLVNEQTSLSLRPVGRTPGLASYMAPELRDVPDALRSRCSDVFAFGILIYETYAGVCPKLPVDRLQSRQRPERASISRNDMTDAVWKVACACWAHAPFDRPSMDNVIKMMRRAQRPELAPVTATTNGNLWTNTNLAALLSQIASSRLPYGTETPRVHSYLPNKFVLEGPYEEVPGLRPIVTGASITIVIGRPKPSIGTAIRRYLLPAAGESENELVAIKYMHHSDDLDRNRQLDRALEKELTPLKHCAHRNILRVLGLWIDPRTTLLGIVSQFADQGDLKRYMRGKPSFPELNKILLDIATGLEYLHKRRTGENQCGIAHGDLHPGSVLIMTDWAGIKAVLGSFGLCEIVDENGMTSSSLLVDGVAGLTAYLGPEIYPPGYLGDNVAPQVVQIERYSGRRTIQGDVFAFGMLSFTTLGGDLSQALCGGDARLPPFQIARSIVEGRRPLREHLVLEERKAVNPSAIDTYWHTIKDCWQGDPAQRPTIEYVRCRIQFPCREVQAPRDHQSPLRRVRIRDPPVIYRR